MNIDDVLNMKDNPDHIDGISDYCDNWCARCPFTGHCKSFSRQQLLYPDGEAPDIESQEFWTDFEDALKASLEILKQVAEEEGFEPMSEEEYAQERAEKDAAIDEIFNHPSYLAADSYRTMVDEWLGDSEALQEKQEELTDFVRLNVAPEQAEIQITAIYNAVEVIRWYQLLIQVQIMEAFHARQVEEEHGENRFQSPAGKAKVAHIAVDRSINAWGSLLNLFPRHETELLEILAQLARIRRMIDQWFPNARAFRRPGFDTHPLPS